MIYNIITTPGNSGKNSTNKNHSRNNDETKVSVSTFNGNPKVKRNSSKMNSKLTGVENDIVEEEMYNTYTPKSDINNEDNEGNVNSISGILNKNDKISQPSGISGKRGSTSFSSHTIFSDTSTLITNGYNRPISPTFTMSNITTSCPTSPRFSSSMPSSPSSPSPISIPMVPIHRDSIASQRDSINSNMSNFSITSNFSNNISSNQRKEWLAKRPAITPNRHRPLYRDSYKNSL